MVSFRWSPEAELSYKASLALRADPRESKNLMFHREKVRIPQF